MVSKKQKIQLPNEKENIKLGWECLIFARKNQELIYLDNFVWSSEIVKKYVYY
jgi:hypothetical protein